MTRALVTFFMASLIVLGGCGGNSKNGEDEDTSIDTPSDSMDTGTDPVDDVEPGDTETDTAGDTVTDAPVDTTGDAPTSGLVGDPCTEDGDCEDTLGTEPFCLEDIPMGPGGTLEFPGGYCSATCTPDGGECGDGAICFGGGGPTSTRRCYKECTDDSDCRESEGYECHELWGGMGFVCWPVMTGP
jgi:hypothetical protein